MSEATHDRTVTLEFTGRDDTHADLEVMVDTLHDLAPKNVVGIAGRADLNARGVWLMFTVEGATEATANRLESDLRDAIIEHANR